MEESLPRPYRLEKELSRLFELKTKIDAVLSVSMLYLNQFMDSERSSIFLFQHGNQKLTIFKQEERGLYNRRPGIIEPGSPYGGCCYYKSRRYIEAIVTNRESFIKAFAG